MSNHPADRQPGDALAMQQTGWQIIHFNLGQDVMGGLEILTQLGEERRPFLARMCLSGRFRAK